MTTAGRVVVAGAVTLIPVVLVAVALTAALTRTAHFTSSIRDEVGTRIAPVLDLTDELGEAAVLLDRWFASGADHDREAFVAHAGRVDAAFAPLRSDRSSLTSARLDTAWESWSFVRDTVAGPAFVLPPEAQARTGLLATFSTSLAAVRSDLSAITDAATNAVVDVAEDAEGTAATMRALLIVTLALATAVGVWSLVWLVRDLRRGLGRVVDAAAAIEAGRFDGRILDEGLHGDLVPVARAFNAMAARVEQHRRELQGVASHDGLTGLLNRRAFTEELTTELERSHRYGHLTALLLLDIDHFKRVNDTHGHPAGDAVLRAVAEQVTSAVRAIDRVGRWGGEEMAVLLPETDEGPACRVAERIGALVAERSVVVDGAVIRVTASLGVAVSSSEGPDELVRRADQALYHAKEAGRNRVVVAGA